MISIIPITTEKTEQEEKSSSPSTPEEYRQRLKSILGSWSTYREKEEQGGTLHHIVTPTTTTSNENIMEYLEPAPSSISSGSGSGSEDESGDSSGVVHVQHPKQVPEEKEVNDDDSSLQKYYKQKNNESGNITVTTEITSNRNTIFRERSQPEHHRHRQTNHNNVNETNGNNPTTTSTDIINSNRRHNSRSISPPVDVSLLSRFEAEAAIEATNHNLAINDRHEATTTPTSTSTKTTRTPQTSTTTITTQSSSPFKANTEWLLDVGAGEQHQQREDTPNQTSSSSFSKEWIDQWTQAGLSKYVSLPMICVLGDTSSGKSSVLSSLIGLELPSASTLTTKCPVLIQLLNSSSSSSSSASDQQKQQEEEATVRIQWHENMHSKSSHSSPRHIKRMLEQKNGSNSPNNATKHPPSPPPPPPPIWKPQTIRGKDLYQIPTIIQKAQSIILNYRETLISPDVICVTLTSPKIIEELTLVDLPGIVQFQHTQDSSLLSQVEQVVLDYVHNPRSILLPVLAAPTNIYNSKVLQWTRQVDPTTHRTIPVLTKPDLIDPGSESDVLELLVQHTGTTSSNSVSSNGGGGGWKHGVFMVKNRGQALLDQSATIQQGLQEEAEYFATTQPWNAIDGSILGIPALRGKLAKVLWQVMKDSLPLIIKEIQQQYDAAQNQLENMGTIYNTKGEQRKYYHSITQKLVNQVCTSLSGKRSGTRLVSLRRGKHNRTGVRINSSSNNKQLSNTGTTAGTGISSTMTSGASKLHAACGEFFKAIQAGSLATISSLVEGAHVLVTCHGSGDDVRGELVYVDPQQRYACVDYTDDKDHTTDVLFDGVAYVADQPDFEVDEVWSDGSRVFIGRTGGHFDSLRKLPLQQIRTDPSWLDSKMDQFRTDDLACFVNVDMFQQIVADFVIEDWAPHCFELIQILKQLLSTTLNEALQEQLEGTRFPMLKSLVERTCHRVAKRLVDNAEAQVQEHLESEEQHPYTQDQVLLQAMNETRLSTLQKDLELQLRLDQEGVVYDTQAIQTILNRVFGKHKRQNWMAEQMELVLSCYGKVATQRVLDRTPQICWQAYRSLPNAISEELGCVTDEILETCLWESPESREKFSRLTTKLHELQSAVDCVQSMRATHLHHHLQHHDFVAQD